MKLLEIDAIRHTPGNVGILDGLVKIPLEAGHLLSALAGVRHLLAVGEPSTQD